MLKSSDLSSFRKELGIHSCLESVPFKFADLRLPMNLQYPGFAPEMDPLEKLIFKEILSQNPDAVVEIRKFMQSAEYLDQDTLTTWVSNGILLPSGLLRFSGKHLEVVDCLDRPEECQRMLESYGIADLMRMFPCVPGYFNIPVVPGGSEIPGKKVLLCDLQIVPILAAALGSLLVIQRKTRHILFSFPYAVCQNRRIVMIQEQPVNPLFDKPFNLSYLGDFLMKVFPEKFANNKLKPREIRWFHNVVNQICLSILHTLMIMDESYGICLYPLTPDSVILTSHMYKEGFHSRINENLQQADYFEYPLNQGHFRLPNLGFLAKIHIDTPDASVYRLQGETEAIVWNRSDQQTNNHWFVLGNMDLDQLTQVIKDVENVNLAEQRDMTKTLSAAEVEEVQDLEVRRLATKMNSEFAKFNDLFLESMSRYSNLNLRPTRVHQRGYDAQVFFGTFMIQVVHLLHLWDFAADIFITGTILDYLNLRFGFHLVNQTPVELWKVSPRDIFDTLIRDVRDSRDKVIIPLGISDPLLLSVLDLYNREDFRETMLQNQENPKILFILVALDSLEVPTAKEAKMACEKFLKQKLTAPFPELSDFSKSFQEALDQVFMLNHAIPVFEVQENE